MNDETNESLFPPFLLRSSTNHLSLAARFFSGEKARTQEAEEGEERYLRLHGELPRCYLLMLNANFFERFKQMEIDGMHERLSTSSSSSSSSSSPEAGTEQRTQEEEREKIFIANETLHRRM